MTANTARQPKATCAQPTDDGCDGGRDAEDHRRHAHEALGTRPVVQIADHRAAEHHADAGGHALQDTRRDQELVVRRERAGERADRIERHAPDHDRAAPDGVGERPMHQRRERERQHVRRDHLLKL